MRNEKLAESFLDPWWDKSRDVDDITQSLQWWMCGRRGVMEYH